MTTTPAAPRPPRGRRPILPPGGELVVQITGLDEDGAGTGPLTTADGSLLEVHVPGTLPGERVRARLLHVSPHAPRAWAERLALETTSTERVEPSCRRFGTCGGCTLQHLSGGGQLQAKREHVQRALSGSGLAVEVAEVLASPAQLGYRAFAKYVVAHHRDRQVYLASYRPRSHQPVEMSPCTVVEPAVARVAAAHVAWLTAHPLPLRYLLLRASHDGQVLAVWVSSSDLDADAEASAGQLLASEPALRGIVLNVNRGEGDALVASDGSMRLLAGADHLVEKVGELSLRISARSFFQINRGQAAHLYALATELAAVRPGETVVDLYAGVGGLALSLARAGARVVGVELEACAVADAGWSAAASGLDARFRAGDAARFGELFPEVTRADVVLLNPPRKGCSPGALDATLALQPDRLVYVSCSPESLARDLGPLGAAGYQVRSVRPVDLFPHTAHVETVVLLSR